MASWRDFLGSKFQSASSMSKSVIKGKIEEAYTETVTGRGKEEKNQVIIKINCWEKAFGVNIGNCERLSAKWGDDMDDWVGKMIEIKVVPSKMEGKTVKGFEMTPIGK